MKPTPAGELPTQDAEKVTGEPNSPTDVTMIVVEPLKPWMIEIVFDDEVIEKSGLALVVVSVVVLAGAITTVRSTT